MEHGRLFFADLVTKPLYHLKKLCYNGIEFYEMEIKRVDI